MRTKARPLDSMETMTRHLGGMTIVRGLLAVIFGTIAIRRPDIAAGAFVIVFAVYALADGVLDFVLAARFGRAGLSWGWYALEGVASVGLGIVALAYPALTLMLLVVLVAVRALMLGVFEIGAAIIGEELDSRWLLGLTGALSIGLGILLLASPATGGLALIWTIGVYAVVFGIAVCALGFRTLRIGRSIGKTPPAAPVPT